MRKDDIQVLLAKALSMIIAFIILAGVTVLVLAVLLIAGKGAEAILKWIKLSAHQVKFIFLLILIGITISCLIIGAFANHKRRKEIRDKKTVTNEELRQEERDGD